MLRINDLTSDSVQEKQASRSPFESETGITLVFSFLVVIFSIPFMVLFPAIATIAAHLGSAIFQGSDVSCALKIIPFVLLSAIGGVIILYFVRLVRVATKLFQSFWASLEED